jgi:SAM-dependent methyltransferase
MSVRVRLVFASGLMLFLELCLIRWLGAHLLHLSYFSNMVLLGSFLGIGLGFLRAKPDRSPPMYFPVVLMLLLGLVLIFHGGIDRSGTDLIYFTTISTSGPPPWLVLPAVFILVAAAMMGPGELVAACFLRLPRLDAYRFDLLGSLAGTLLFALMSFLGTSPLVWGTIVAVVTAALLPLHRSAMAAAAVIACVLFLGWGTLNPRVIWSPYYQIETIPGYVVPAVGVPYHFVSILANGVPHQAVVPLGTRLAQEPFYRLPYERSANQHPAHVLVIGAGNGSDVALALLQGATQVDAVEIDPRIKELGVQLNPQHPYQDPRVHAYVTDGRAFLHNTVKKYDLIVFALPDSLTLVAGSNQLRLESYLFTVEALSDVRKHLNPGGTFAMYNYYRQNWLVGRLAATAEQAFGHVPCLDTYQNRSAVIVAGVTTTDQVCAPASTSITEALLATAPSPVHDSRPFPYLRDRTIPSTFLVIIGVIILLSLLAVRLAGGRLRRMAPYLDLACLGAAFLLLETRAVTWFALLFGTTWLVNAIVFAGVLGVVLTAVEITRRLPVRPTRPVAFVLLGAALLLAWLVPTSWLLSLPLGWRIPAAVVIAFGPIFASNIVFATRFATTPDGTSAFAANLLGAMIGGCLEYLALIIGYPGLLGVAGVLYLGAFAIGPRSATLVAPTS